MYIEQQTFCYSWIDIYTFFHWRYFMLVMVPAALPSLKTHFPPLFTLPPTPLNKKGEDFLLQINHDICNVKFSNNWQGRNKAPTSTEVMIDLSLHMIAGIPPPTPPTFKWSTNELPVVRSELRLSEPCHRSNANWFYAEDNVESSKLQ